MDRKLTTKELKLVEDKVGDYINWYEAILNAIDTSNIKPKNSMRLKKAKDKKKNS